MLSVKNHPWNRRHQVACLHHFREEAQIISRDMSCRGELKHLGFVFTVWDEVRVLCTRPKVVHESFERVVPRQLPIKRASLQQHYFRLLTIEDKHFIRRAVCMFEEVLGPLDGVDPLLSSLLPDAVGPSKQRRDASRFAQIGKDLGGRARESVNGKWVTLREEHPNRFVHMASRCVELCHRFFVPSHGRNHYLFGCLAQEVEP